MTPHTFIDLCLHHYLYLSAYLDFRVEGLDLWDWGPRFRV
jgi:hypothetical protein